MRAESPQILWHNDITMIKKTYTNNSNVCHNLSHLQIAG